jgi:hypothetical protein
MRLPIAVLIALLAGCSRDAAEPMASGAASVDLMAEGGPMVEAAAPASPQDAPAPGATDTTGLKIIRTATLRLRVDDYAETRLALDTLVARHNGYIASESETNYDARIENTMTIRVAAHRFQALLDTLLALAEGVEQKEVQAEDVTAQFVDIQARLHAKQVAEARYLDILRQARNVEEILSVENQLRAIREEVESTEGQLRYLRDRIAYSTLTLTFYEGTSGLERPGFFRELGRALEDGWQGLLALLVAAVTVWPLWLILAALVWLGRRWWRRRNQPS